MSWQEYVDKHLVATQHVTKGAICGLAGGTWATSPGFNVSEAEIKCIAGAFNDPTALRTNGLYVNGQKFFLLTATDKVLRGKLKSSGVTIAKTNSAMIIGYYDEPIQPGNSSKVVESLADYLVDSNC